MAEKTAAQPEASQTLEAIAASENLHLEGDAIDRLVALGREASGVTLVKVEIPNAPFGLPKEFPLAVQHGENPKLVSVKSFAEEYRDRPERKKGTARTLTLDSFIRLVDRHKTDDSVVFGDTDWTKPSLTAVIDYSEKSSGGAAAHGTHRVSYSFPLSNDWKAWLESNNKQMSQEEFALFLEEHLPDLSTADERVRNWFERDLGTTVGNPSQIMTLARDLQINVESKFKQATNLQSGANKLVFEESHTGADGQPVTVPGGFVLHIAPFDDGDKVEVPVRLRYRPHAGKILWRYQIYRPDQVIQEAVDHALADVGSKTGLPVFEGHPEMNG